MERPVDSVRLRIPTRLTPLQLSVLEQLALGYTDKEIAEHLGISPAGAKKHLAALRRRYVVSNRVALLRSAIESGAIRIGTGAETRSATADAIRSNSDAARCMRLGAGVAYTVQGQSQRRADRTLEPTRIP
ncbi:MAG: helix-turn-helix transcriptional regulator [Gemmatimonadetes bacterium]|nr:helix-turn-helix transcriptional regulator [Gemmatimonadota bacterium]